MILVNNPPFTMGVLQTQIRWRLKHAQYGHLDVAPSMVILIWSPKPLLTGFYEFHEYKKYQSKFSSNLNFKIWEKNLKTKQNWPISLIYRMKYLPPTSPLFTPRGALLALRVVPGTTSGAGERSSRSRSLEVIGLQGGIGEESHREGLQAGSVSGPDQLPLH
jgi:hypothetical protein